MNWMLIIVLAVLILNCILGIKKGLIRVVYSMVVGVVLLLILGAVTPKVSAGIMNTTSWDEKMTDAYETNLKKMVEDKLEGDQKLENDQKLEDYRSLEEIGIHIPKFVLDKAEDLSDAASNAAEKMGIYRRLAAALTEYTFFGITLLVLAVVFIILYFVVERLLKIISKLPVIHQANALGGGILGLVEGFLIVWIAFGVITLFSGTPAGVVCNEQIQASPVLVWIFDNNLLLKLVMLFF